MASRLALTERGHGKKTGPAGEEGEMDRSASAVKQLEYQGTPAATPRAQLDVMPDPEVITATADRDCWLVEALRLREATAAERLVATFGDRAYRLAIGITGNQQDAEEVVQDAFLSVVRKIDTFRGDSAFGSWLHRIVANAAYQLLRTRRGRSADISLDSLLPVFDGHGRHVAPVADWSMSLEDPARQTELRMVLHAALEELPADYRAAALLRDVEGLSPRDIAEALGLTVANVRTRVHRARLLLRKRLSMFMANADASVEGVGREEDARESSAVTHAPPSASEG
jgi:RNA polymerase sigma-70 factor, ECF subfamily